jgi:hypothetical protein
LNLQLQLVPNSYPRPYEGTESTRLKARMQPSACWLLVLACAVQGAAANAPVDLRGVSALTFRRGRMTAARRVAAVPQLTCVGGPCSMHADSIDTIQCTNVGEDDHGDVQWRCDADLEHDVKLGEVAVSCEGYSSSADRLKLRGSCGLEYTLRHTHSHRRAHDPNRHNVDNRYSSGRDRYSNDYKAQQSRYMATTYDDSITASTTLFFGLVVLGVLVCLREKSVRQANPSARGFGAAGGYSGGGGAGLGGAAAAGGASMGAGVPFGGGAGSGFWSGAAAGGILANLLGNRGYGQRGAYGGGWGGGWGGRRAYWGGNTYYAGGPRPAAAAYESAGGGGDVDGVRRRRSTGYGGTSTR